MTLSKLLGVWTFVYILNGLNGLNGFVAILDFFKASDLHCHVSFQISQFIVPVCLAIDFQVFLFLQI